MVLVAGDLAADLWRQPLPMARFTSRPVFMARQIVGEAAAMLHLDSAERQQEINNHFQLQDYGKLIQVALATTPESENVALWVQADNTFDYFWRKADYWLYPRKIVVVRDMTPTTLDHLRAAGVGTLIIYGQDPPWTVPGFVIYQPEPAFAVVRVNTSEPSFGDVPGYTAAPLNLENGIRLDGYQVVPPLLDGDTVVLLRWQNTQPVTQSYTVFVHIFSGDRLAAQDDSTPALGQLPTFLWKPGDVVIDAHRLVLPRDQRQGAKLCVGMYDSLTMQRLPVQRAEGYETGPGIVCRPLSP